MNLVGSHPITFADKFFQSYVNLVWPMLGKWKKNLRDQLGLAQKCVACRNGLQVHSLAWFLAFVHVRIVKIVRLPLILKFLALCTLLKFLFFLQELAKTVAKLAEDGKVLSMFCLFTFYRRVFTSNIAFLSSSLGIFYFNISTHKRSCVLLSCMDYYK